jgi:hypothetical protein
MNNEGHLVGLYAKLILDFYNEVGAEQFISLICKGLLEHQTPFLMTNLLSSEEWIKIPGIDKKLFFEYKENCKGFYKRYLEECTGKLIVDSNAEVAKGQAELFKKFGRLIPGVVWGYTFASDLCHESDARRCSLSKPLTKIVLPLIKDRPGGDFLK